MWSCRALYEWGYLLIFFFAGNVGYLRTRISKYIPGIYIYGKKKKKVSVKTRQRHVERVSKISED